jgi:phosphoribosylaminoimidazole-succinocarboxamide synthase
MQRPPAPTRAPLARPAPRGAPPRAARAMPPPRAAPAGVESLGALSPAVEAAIEAGLTNCLSDTDLDLGPRAVRHAGKVRDTYLLGGLAILVTTDRLSAFDRALASIPFKGQVLNQTSAWWMHNTHDIVPNALLATPDPCVSVMTRCDVVPIEFVVRGFMTGSTSTSLWTHYNNGERNYCGNAFPDGMTKNQRLERNVVTPTTKAADHDEPISPKEIVARGLATQALWDAASAAALALFARGQAVALSRGLLLVDTKYEFGVDAEGGLRLIDEIHTPDSSRYWLADTYEDRVAAGLEPQSIDKEFVRLWFRERCDPYADAVLPEAPAPLVAELSRRYVTLYERITGLPFVPADGSVPAGQRMAANTRACLLELGANLE